MRERNAGEEHAYSPLGNLNKKKIGGEIVSEERKEKLRFEEANFFVRASVEET